VALSPVPRIQKNQTLVETIAQELIRYIAANRLRGGDRLPSERDLMEMAGVSRLPLREALCMLKGLGIVEARHGKGVFVKRLDISAVFGMLSPLLKTQADLRMSDIIEVRRHLETSIAELAAVHRTEENLRVLETCLQGMRENLLAVQTFTEHDMAFHQELARATGNLLFHVFMASITDLLCQVQMTFPDKAEFRGASIRYHERILRAVRAGDAGQARAAMEEHIRNVAERLETGRAGENERIAGPERI
jgi:GntR family transcriptional repressor for pyruvate dehydrogenase complex